MLTKGAINLIIKGIAITLNLSLLTVTSFLLEEWVSCLQGNTFLCIDFYAVPCGVDRTNDELCSLSIKYGEIYAPIQKFALPLEC